MPKIQKIFDDTELYQRTLKVKLKLQEIITALKNPVISMVTGFYYVHLSQYFIKRYETIHKILDDFKAS